MIGNLTFLQAVYTDHNMSKLGFTMVSIYALIFILSKSMG